MTRTRERPERIGVRPAEDVESVYRTLAAEAGRAAARGEAGDGPAPGRGAPWGTGRTPAPDPGREQAREGARQPVRQGAVPGGAGDEPPGAASEGAADAYRWALAREGHGPVTGVPTREVPDLWRLTAEADAAAVLLDDPVCPPEERAYVRGVHDALAWLCGHSDERAG
ncbi:MULTISPECIES: hypothetical protein [Streptomyces]|uniref:Uncharacterized protein n=1 Tax=Streptomyces sudanensis TaxID=436397 RepID=A0ABY4TE23_9ACTN|nr:MULTISPECIES: hypothetical protein [Streptomyces]MCP9958105.1 hypothetical protein [Streptomyces sudanensis]MCP9987217.1 hypothetical protein [Streptomyces sudanensis]MCQ0001373.1 hypothetical protein [Streptomyces sudanensis]URN16972.1 hypothetical protein MW084_14705 [Streptomyces sudanensis]